MKKLLRLLLPTLLLCLCACGGDSTDDPDPQPDPPAPPVEDKITFPDDKLPAPLFSDTGGEAEISFTASGPWTAAVSDVTEESGATGAKSTPCGTGAWDRTVGTGTRGSAGETGAWSPADTANGPGTTARNANAANSPGTTVQNGPSRAAQTWLSVSPASGDAGAATVVLTAQPNDSDEDRSALLTLASGTAKQTLTVTQMRRGALVAAPGSFTVDNAGGEISIEVTRNVDFDTEIDAGWITRIGTRALETETLVFHIAENTGYDNRMGTITFTSKDGTLTQEVKVYQAQTDAIVVSPTNYVFDEKKWIFEIEVRANVDFTVENPNVLWLEPVETRALKTHTLKYRLYENTTYDSRSAEIRIVDTKRNLSQTITVTQLQKDALVVAQSSYTVAQEGGEITVELRRNVDFDVEINRPWITQVETRGLTTEYLRFRIAENPAESNREGVIAFVSKDREIRQEVRIVQEGKPDEEAIIREYLVRLYRDTDGDHWTAKNNWCSDRPINEWDGVTYSDGKLKLSLHFNNLNGSIDLSGCTALTELHCSYNQLTSLDVSGCTALTKLECWNNQLTSLDVSGCTALTKLECWNNQLTSLNASDCTALTELECRNNQLTGLDVSGCTALTALECRNNQLTSLDVSGCTALKRLDCSSNQLTNLNASGCTALTTLYYEKEQLVILNISETGLNRFNCVNGQLTNLDVSGCTALTALECWNNQLTSLNASDCTALTELECRDNQLTSLNVSGCTALLYLWCYNNQLTGLDVSGCTALKGLDCRSNQLTDLDVSGYTALAWLCCDGNQLTSLDISGYTALIELFCSYNQLTSLNVSGCTALKRLDCSSNQLTHITGLLDCASMRYCKTINNKICQEIPFHLLIHINTQPGQSNYYLWIDGFRYEYYSVWNEALGKHVTHYRDLGVGWWYPGEPGSLRHDW